MLHVGVEGFLCLSPDEYVFVFCRSFTVPVVMRVVFTVASTMHNT